MELISCFWWILGLALKPLNRRKYFFILFIFPGQQLRDHACPPRAASGDPQRSRQLRHCQPSLRRRHRWRGQPKKKARQVDRRYFIALIFASTIFHTSTAFNPNFTYIVTVTLNLNSECIISSERMYQNNFKNVLCYFRPVVQRLHSQAGVLPAWRGHDILLARCHCRAGRDFLRKEAEVADIERRLGTCAEVTQVRIFPHITIQVRFYV